MDISDLKTRPLHDEGAEMRVKGPNGKLTDFYITLVGCDSEAWEKIVRDAQKAALKTGDGVDSKQLLAKATLGWRGLKENGKDVVFTTKKVYELYTQAPYIYEQADLFVANRGNFLKPKSKK